MKAQERSHEPSLDDAFWDLFAADEPRIGTRIDQHQKISLKEQDGVSVHDFPAFENPDKKGPLKDQSGGATATTTRNIFHEDGISSIEDSSSSCENFTEDDDETFDEHSITEEREHKLRSKCHLVWIVLFVILIAGAALPTGIVLFLRREGYQSASTEDSEQPAAILPLEPERANLTIGEYVGTSADFSRISALLSGTGIINHLNDNSPGHFVTSLLPTNGNFESNAATMYGTYLFQPQWTAHGRSFLENLLISREIDGTDLVGKIEMISGEKVLFTDGKMNEVGVEETNRYIGTNGVVHVVNNLVAPSWYRRNIIDELSSNHEGFLMLLKQVALLDILRGSEPKTLFVPTTEAMKTLPEMILNDEEHLREALLYHLVPDVNLQLKWSESMGDDEPLSVSSALEGKPLRIHVHDALKVSELSSWGSVNGVASVISMDVLVTNGILHRVDSFLVPPVDGFFD